MLEYIRAVIAANSDTKKYPNALNESPGRVMYCLALAGHRLSVGDHVNIAFDTLMAEGLAASGRNDIDGALGAWRRAMSVEPRSALPHFLMGAEFAQARRLAEAEAAFANAVVLEPELHTARYQLGLLQFSSGRAAVAMVTWEPLFRLDEQSAIGRFVQGFAALAADDFDNALRHFAAGTDANRINEPMNADIAQVVLAIRHVLSSHAAPGHAASEDAHVLLAAYRQQSSIH